MEGELYYVRFHYILGSFVVSMVILICSSNWFFLLLGWDGLGVTRFLLICFYKTRVS
jgi:NADH:ubiquinone oxidoreductase subunit 5 (subunit L)/multisubunit Na+/H+ antiporter MnhA subunit